jgi:pentatricopeptide repeat protein
VEKVLHLAEKMSRFLSDEQVQDLSGQIGETVAKMIHFNLENLGIKRAEKLVAKLRAQQIKVEQRTLLKFLRFYFKSNDIGAVWNLANEMQRNLDLCNVLLKGFLSLWDFAGVQKVLDEMFKRRIVADLTTYNVLVRGYCEIGEFSKVQMILQEMGANRISKDTEMLNSILHYHSFVMNDSAKVSETLKMYASHHLEANARTLVILLCSSLKQRRYEEAVTLCDRMCKTELTTSVPNEEARISAFQPSLSFVFTSALLSRDPVHQRLVLRIQCYDDQPVPRSCTFLRR